MQVGSAVKGIIQIVRDEYSVVSLPDFDNKIGFVGLLDYNTRQTATRHALFSQANFTISQLPSKTTGSYYDCPFLPWNLWPSVLAPSMQRLGRFDHPCIVYKSLHLDFS